MSAPPRPIAIAPAANGQPSPSQQPAPPTMPYTCLTCARRKVKCDKVTPICSTCRKGKFDCEYQAPAPRKRRRRMADDNTMERLERYESILKEHGLLKESEKESPSDANSTPGQHASEDQPPPKATDGSQGGTLLSGGGKTRLVSNNLWRTLGEEGLDVDGDSEEDDPEAGESGFFAANTLTPQLDPLSSSVLGGFNSPVLNLIDYHPTYEAAMRLWKVYTEYVEPLVKIVHVPTGLAMVQRSASNPSSISKSTECLLFAIYHFAVSALEDEDCERLFSQPRSLLVAKYYDAIRQALINASFLRTTELTILQAYVLFLLSVRNRYDINTFWILTGVAVRIAQRLGLHRDGTDLGLNPFDTQIRGRLFWQLLPLDGIASQLCGTSVSLISETWDTKQPLNINDDDIWPGMTEQPKERTGATDMIFCLTRAMIGKFQKENKVKIAPWANLLTVSITDPETLREAHDLIDQLESELESKFLRYCDFLTPIHCLAMAMGRGAICMAKFRIRLPSTRGTTVANVEERRRISELALKVLEYGVLARTNSTLRPFRWHLHSIGPFDAIIWALTEVRRSDCLMDRTLVWGQLGRVYEVHPELTTQTRTLHTGIGRFVIKAWDATNSPSDPQPAFVTSIRNYLDRRDVRRERSKSSQAASSAGSSNPFAPALDDSTPGGVVETPNTIPNASLLFANPSDESIDWGFWEQLMGEQEGCFVSG